MDESIKSISIPVFSSYGDHSLGTRSVLPAVVIMEIMASEVKNSYPDFACQQILNGVFSRFLEVDFRVKQQDIILSSELFHDNLLTVKLSSRVKFKKMTRQLEHASLSFKKKEKNVKPDSVFPESCFEEKRGLLLDKEQVYERFVPFGSAFQSVINLACPSENKAWGEVQATPLSVAYDAAVLGAPLPLDGAFHIACVLGQQHFDFIPLPVGFDRLVIHKKPKYNAVYRVLIELQSKGKTSMLVNIGLFDEENNLCGEVVNLKMADTGLKKRKSV